MEEKFKYTAFISYSHADQAVVKWLHRALENYRVPVTLVGKETRAGKVPGKFKPIFRDRDDLSAAASLSGSIKEALRQSRFLIVVCSPAAAKSIWVEKEIREFRKLHGQDHILCLVADADPEGKAPIFPEALWDKNQAREAFEPIAADMRPTGDGKRMAKLKLISGLLGVELDTLVKRDVKRRQVQMAVMAATFSAATVVLSVLLFMAIEARKEADANREKAEELVEFMLGDLRGKLEPMGNLQIMDTISEKALDYYAGIDPDNMTSERLRARSQVLLMLGETQDLRGNTEAARDAFMEAHQTTAELLERDPDNPALIFDHSQSLYWLGLNDLRLKNYPAAEGYFQDYAENIELLVTIEPENRRYQSEAGHAYSNLGTVLFAQGKFLRAQKDFEKALEVFEAQAVEKPESEKAQFDLAQAYARLADSVMEVGGFKEAENLRQMERRIYQVLLNRNPDNRGAWGALAETHRTLGQLAYFQGEEKASLNDFDRGIEILTGLTAYDRENTEWRETLARLYTDKAKALIARRDNKEAIEVLARARALTSELLAINPGYTDWVLKDFRARLVLAEANLNSRKREEALQQVQALAGEFYQAYPPEERTSEMHFLSAKILDVLAEAYRKTGDKDAAKENWTSVYNILQPFKETGGLTVISLLPKARERSGGG